MDEEAGCNQVMHLIAGVRGSVAGLIAEVMEHHVRAHVVTPRPDPDGPAAVEPVIEVIRAYVK